MPLLSFPYFGLKTSPGIFIWKYRGPIPNDYSSQTSTNIVPRLCKMRRSRSCRCPGHVPPGCTIRAHQSLLQLLPTASAWWLAPARPACEQMQARAENPHLPGAVITRTEGTGPTQALRVPRGPECHSPQWWLAISHSCPHSWCLPGMVSQGNQPPWNLCKISF